MTDQPLVPFIGRLVYCFSALSPKQSLESGAESLMEGKKSGRGESLMEGNEGEAAGKCIGARAMWTAASPVTLTG